MRYTKPHVLSTQKAHSTVQTGANHLVKQHPINMDSTNTGVFNSTSGAYEADE
jgi:hypothetical protein